MSGSREYAANFGAQLLGRSSSVLAVTLVSILIARVYGAEMFGRYAYVMAYLGVFGGLAEFGTTLALARGIGIASDRSSYWGSFLLLRLFLAAAAAAIAMALARPLRPDLFEVLLIGALGLPALASRFFDPVFQTSGRPWYSAGSSVAYAVVLLAAMVVAILEDSPLRILVLVYVAANAAYAVLAFSLSMRCLRPRFAFEWRHFAEILRIAAPLGVGTLFVLVNMRIDILLLGVLASDQAVGLYNAAYRFLDVCAILAVTLATPVVPIFSRKAAEGTAELRETYFQIHEGIAIALLPVVLLVPLVSGDVITLMFGEAFRASAPVLDVLAWVGILAFYAQFGSAVNVAFGEVRHGYWNGALAASINIGLNLWWIPRYGILGAAYATLASEIALVGVSQFYVRKNLGKLFRIGRWGRILLANGCLLLVAAAAWDIASGWRVLVALAGYAAAVLALGVLSRADISRLLALRRRGIRTGS